MHLFYKSPRLQLSALLFSTEDGLRVNKCTCLCLGVLSLLVLLSTNMRKMRSHGYNILAVKATVGSWLTSTLQSRSLKPQLPLLEEQQRALSTPNHSALRERQYAVSSAHRIPISFTLKQTTQHVLPAGEQVELQMPCRRCIRRIMQQDPGQCLYK